VASSAEPLTDQQFEAWKAFLRAHVAVLRVLDAELEAEQGMPLTYFDVLIQLSRAGGRLRMSELADAVLLSRSGITRLVDRMGRDGLVRREPCPTDRRALYAVLTPAGEKALQEALPVHLRGIAEHFARHLSDREAKTLSAALGRLVPSRDDTTLGDLPAS
jgi:DNA-binding MarR family transcriptional regulator